jgi:hypothetical protein
MASSDIDRAINAAVAIVSLAATGQRCTLVLQTAQALPVFAVDHARAPDGPAAYGKRGRGQVGQHIS